jgi:glycosyltransferase involved in cell wall biosynthesis
MRILELCIFSAGICGVYSRVKEEAIRLSKNKHEVRIMSSNLTKGSDEIASLTDKIQNVKIQRFPAIKLGGESFMMWNFEKEALKFKPEIIIVHSYRHLHTTKALKIAKKINAKVFLVTHAPFDRDSTRSFIANQIVNLYDLLIGSNSLNKYNKILAITKWEIPFLLKIGAKKENIEYIPNGIPEEFFTIKNTAKEEDKILFLGRISPIKNLEIAITGLSKSKNKDIKFEIVGPAEEEYKKQLEELINTLNLQNRVFFSLPIYDIKEKIKKLDSAKIFILPSKSEGMPQSLVEAMAREKVVLASDNRAAKDLIKNNQNGFLFKNNDSEDFANKLNLILSLNSANQNKIKTNALNSVKQFSWNKIIEKIEKVIKN